MRERLRPRETGGRGAGLAGVVVAGALVVVLGGPGEGGVARSVGTPAGGAASAAVPPGASAHPIPAGARAAAGGTVSIWPDPVRSGRPALAETGDRRARSAAALIACLTPPGGRSQCRARSRRAEPGGRVGVAVRAGRLGPWRLGLRAAGPVPAPPGALDAQRSFRVIGGRPRLLATGDSEIQGIDDLLGAALPGFRVTSEAHISTGISKPRMFDWVARAAAQARADHPDATVVYIGANDGFALPTRSGRLANCCGPAWVEAFAGRTRAMMASYVRGGAGRVYWLTLPAPRDPAAAPTFRAIDRAYARAAAAFPAEVHLLDLGAVFTPGGRYRDTMAYGGRTVTVRQPDGYHLSDAGNRIATGILIADMRADGLLG